MLTNVRTFAVDGWTDSMEPPLRVFQTAFFSTPTKVTATAALSVVSLGLSNWVPGTAGASIWKVGIARPGGAGTDTVDLSSAWNTQGTFERCVFVTFVLSLRNAAGVGVFTVHTHG